MLDIKLINKSNNPEPSYATDGSAGFDLASNETIIIPPSKVQLVGTGLFYEIPLGFEMQIRPRSGLAAKFGVTVLNSPGTIDSDYRGEIMVIMINHGKNDFKIEPGDRIAQGVIARVLGKSDINFNISSELSTTERGEGGFGSTGK